MDANTTKSAERMNHVLAHAHAAYARHVAGVNYLAIEALDSEAVRRSVESLVHGPGFTYLPKGSPVADSPELVVTYFVMETALQYAFWQHGDGGTLVRYTHRGLVGAVALSSAFHEEFVRALEARAALEAPFETQLQALRSHLFGGWAKLSLSAVEDVLGAIPMISSREQILRELLDPHSDMEGVVELLCGSARAGRLDVKDAEHMRMWLPKSYRDSYLKKAQLALVCIAHTLKVPSENLDITAPADYQLPRVLRRMGLIEYSPRLAAVVDSGLTMKSGDVYEQAIRAATTLAVEALRQKTGCSIAHLDTWLWNQRNACADDKFHLCFTTQY